MTQEVTCINVPSILWLSQLLGSCTITKLLSKHSIPHMNVTGTSYSVVGTKQWGIPVPLVSLIVDSCIKPVSAGA